jgi:5'(3')-deoxyribonucleotidase
MKMTSDTIRVLVDVDIDEVLADISATQVVEHFNDNNDLDALLEAIGIDEVKKYFNLVEVKDVE